MTNYTTERLYTLSINSFYKHSFFFFYLFAIDTKDIELLSNYFFKSTYFNLKVKSLLKTNAIINKYNRLFIYYNNLVLELFSLSRLLFNLKELNDNNENIFNTCITYHSVLYTHSYYNFTLKYFFKEYIYFFNNTLCILQKYLKIIYLINIKYLDLFKHIKKINTFFICNNYFKKRFFFYDYY